MKSDCFSLENVRVVDDVSLAVPSIPFLPLRILPGMASQFILSLPVVLRGRLDRDDQGKGRIIDVQSPNLCQLVEGNMKHVLVVAVVVGGVFRILKLSREVGHNTTSDEINNQCGTIYLGVSGRDRMQRHHRDRINHEAEVDSRSHHLHSWLIELGVLDGAFDGQALSSIIP